MWCALFQVRIASVCMMPHDMLTLATAFLVRRQRMMNHIVINPGHTFCVEGEAVSAASSLEVCLVFAQAWPCIPVAMHTCVPPYHLAAHTVAHMQAFAEQQQQRVSASLSDLRYVKMVAATHVQAMKTAVSELVSEAKNFFCKEVAPLLADEQVIGHRFHKCLSLIHKSPISCP